MTGVLEHRREYLRLMRQITLDKGFFYGHRYSCCCKHSPQYRTGLGIPFGTGRVRVPPRGEAGKECCTLCSDKRDTFQYLPTYLHNS